MNKQISMSVFSDELRQVMTKKKEFLDKMEKVVPMEKWLKMIRPFYYEGKVGNKPYELELMVRLYLLQNFYNLSDDMTISEVIDSRAFSEFCSIESENQVPDGETLRRFRNILTENKLQEKLFAGVVEILEKQGLILKKGTIIDSTIISAPSSTKNKDKKRDPEAKSTKKGSNWHFGYKAHIGVDKNTGLVHTVKTTSANVHDVTVAQELLHGEENEIFGDSGYIGANKRENAVIRNKKGKKISYKISRKPSQIKKLTKSGQYKAKKSEHKKSSIRSKVEHVFAVIKIQFKYRKTRYRGLEKQTQKLNMLFALANLVLAERKFLTV